MAANPALSAIDNTFHGLPVIGLVTKTNKVSNVATVLTTMFSYTLPGGSLQSDGDSIEFEIQGHVVDHTLTVYTLTFGGVNILDLSGLAQSNQSGYTLRGRIVRTGATTFKAFVSELSQGGVFALTTIDSATFSADNALTFKVTTAANDDVNVEIATVNIRAQA